MRRTLLRYVVVVFLSAALLMTNVTHVDIPANKEASSFRNLSPIEEVVRLPDYTEEEVAAMRGIPLNPADPNTLFLPPGIATWEDLPSCAGSTVDDQTTAINEAEAEHQRWLLDGTYNRNAKVRVVACRVIPDPTSGISMTVEEYNRWWEENGRPTQPDPAVDHPSGPLYNQP